MSDVAEAIKGEVLPAVTEPGTDIVAAVAKEPGIVLLDRAKFSAWYEKLKADAPTDVDITTTKGRDTLRSFAARVRSEKSAIDKERLRLTADWRDMVSQANDAGKEIREQLDALAEEVRRPLTEWEEAEKARAAEVERIIAGFRSERFVAMGEASEAIKARGAAVYATVIDPDVFQDRADEAEREKKDTVEHLLAAVATAEKAEADRAELERLQREASERAAAEEAQRIEAEAEARRVDAARIAEEQRVAAEQAEQDRIAAAAKEAEDRARREAEEAAEAERQRVQREHQAALDAERAAREQAEREAQAERDRVAAEEAARRAEAQRIADETAKREADQAHRTRVKTAAKKAIMTCGADEETAQKIVLAMIAGEIPAVRITF